MIDDDHLDGGRKGRMMEQCVDEIGLVLEHMHFAESDNWVGGIEFKQTGDGGRWFEGGARVHHAGLHN